MVGCGTHVSTNRTTSLWEEGERKKDEAPVIVGDDRLAMRIRVHNVARGVCDVDVPLLCSWLHTLQALMFALAPSLHQNPQRNRSLLNYFGFATHPWHPGGPHVPPRTSPSPSIRGCQSIIMKTGSTVLCCLVVSSCRACLLHCTTIKANLPRIRRKSPSPRKRAMTVVQTRAAQCL